MDNRLARQLYENNVLAIQKRDAARISLLEKLAVSKDVIDLSVNQLPNPCCEDATAESLQKLILVDPDLLGLLYTANLGLDSNWTQINANLISTQYLIIRKALLTPSGKLFVVTKWDAGDSSFLARADAPGGDFTQIFNKTIADATFGTGTAGTLHILAMGYNPLLPEEVIFVAINSSGTGTFRILPDGSIERVTRLDTLAASGDPRIMTFGGNEWLTGWGAGNTLTFHIDYSGFTGLGSYGGFYHTRAGISATVFLPIGSGDLRVSLDNMQTHFDITGLNLDWGTLPGVTYWDYRMAVDNDGTNLLTSEKFSGIFHSVISHDGGVSFAAVPGLPDGLLTYAFAGGSDIDARFLAVGGGKVWYNETAGDGDWIDVTGDLTTLSATWTSSNVVLPIGTRDNPIIPINSIDVIDAVVTFNNGYGVSSKIEDAINNGVTDKAPSENAVYDALALKQPLDSDLTAIAGLSPTNNDFIQRKSGAWVNRSVSQVATDLETVLDSRYEALLSYTPEDVANKTTDGTLAANSDTLYPSERAVKTYVDGHSASAGQIVEIYRWVSGGGDTFDLPDIAEYILNAFDDGLLVDPLIYSLSSDKTQIVFDSAVTSGHIVGINYIQAQV